MTRIRLVSLLSAVALASWMTACTSSAPAREQNPGATGEQSPAPAIDLVRSGACGDAFFWAESATGDIAVTVDVTYSRPEAHEGTVAVPFTLPGNQVVSVEVLEGQNLSRNFCTDLMAVSSRPESTSPAVAGQGRVTVDSSSSNASGCGQTLGTLYLDGLVAKDGTEFSAITVESRDIGCDSG